MSSPPPPTTTPAASIAELTRLRSQLEDLRAAFTAIRGGGVDAIMVGDPSDERLYTLTSADRPYRVIVQEMGSLVGYCCEWSNYLAHLDRAIWRYPRLVTTLRRAHTAAGDRPGRPM